MLLRKKCNSITANNAWLRQLGYLYNSAMLCYKTDLSIIFTKSHATNYTWVNVINYYPALQAFTLLKDKHIKSYRMDFKGPVPI